MSARTPKEEGFSITTTGTFFEEPYSVGYLVEIINRDLGKALVTARDIKYIRANVYKWKQEGEILSTKSQTDQRDGQSNPS